MASRKNKSHIQISRDRIKTGMLISRLQKNALGELRGPPCEDYPDGRPIEMTPSQVKSAEILLRKAVPDLKQLDHAVAEDSELKVVIRRYSPETDGTGSADN